MRSEEQFRFIALDEPLSAAPLRQGVARSFPAATGDSVTHITVLTSLDHPVNKRFSLNQNQQVQKHNFQNAYFFDATTVPVNGIADLAKLIEFCSLDPYHMLIRGRPVVSNTHRLRKTGENFAEHPEGSYWVMLDFDDVSVPENFDPLSVEAIEWVVAKLPLEFQNVSYFYQHSGSAGILGSDGTAMKKGLNVHLFFWLDRGVLGEKLAAYLTMHCMATGFYTLGENKGGIVDLRCGIDPAPIRSAVQAHYIAIPTVESGVHCRLTTGNRQGLLEKSQSCVAIPALQDDLERCSQEYKRGLVNEYKRDHGYVTKVIQTQVRGKVAVTRYSLAPSREPQLARGGRVFIEGKLSGDGNYLTLYFEGEESRGSWYVNIQRPQLGVRHGDGACMPLKELSQGAHAYVRDSLAWFEEIPHCHLDLIDGYLPSIADFAKAKVSLVLSPTGSGKTTAAVAWIRGRIGQRQLVVYAAPTIALVKQMRDDLTLAGLGPCYYSDVRGHQDLPRFGGVVVTTNHSLPRLLELAYDNGVAHVLIIDEIHQGLDEFMKRNRSQEQLEAAMSKARQSLLLTGTLTDVQRLAIVDITKHALGGLTGDDYCCYEFTAVKRNPLHVLPLNRFDSDLIDQFESIQEKMRANQPIPRFVMLLDTSRMKAYQALVAGCGLEGLAMIVSRPESTEEEIEAARVSEKPILISSPLFGLGLNFAHAPAQLWCRFDHVQADVNQIIQAVNRANRSEQACEVRIYGNVNPDAEFRAPVKKMLKSAIAERLLGEASLAGCLEEHFQLDRVTYQALRKAERDSYVALSVLVRDDAIQNFTVVGAKDLPEAIKDKARIVKEARAAARMSYLQDITDEAKRIGRCEPLFGLMMLEDVYQERKVSWKSTDRRVERQLQNEEAGIIMAMSGISDPAAAQKVSVAKVKRLFGEVSPWLSSQYDRERFKDWAKIEAEKTEKIIVLVGKLGLLKAGAITIGELSASLTRNGQICGALQALVSTDMEFQAIGEKIDALKKAREKIRNEGGRSARDEVKNQGLALLREFLEPLGVTYGKKSQRGREVTDNTKPIIPPNWDLAEMLVILKRQAVRLRALPVCQTVPIVEEGSFFHPDEVRPRSTCEPCVFFHQNVCVRGLPVDWQGCSEPDAVPTCDFFKAIDCDLVLH